MNALLRNEMTVSFTFFKWAAPGLFYFVFSTNCKQILDLKICAMSGWEEANSVTFTAVSFTFLQFTKRSYILMSFS